VAPTLRIEAQAPGQSQPIVALVAGDGYAEEYRLRRRDTARPGVDRLDRLHSATAPGREIRGWRNHPETRRFEDRLGALYERHGRR
jgi:hypothetical protein